MRRKSVQCNRGSINPRRSVRQTGNHGTVDKRRAQRRHRKRMADSGGRVRENQETLGGKLFK